MLVYGSHYYIAFFTHFLGITDSTTLELAGLYQVCTWFVRVNVLGENAEVAAVLHHSDAESFVPARKSNSDLKPELKWSVYWEFTQRCPSL